MLTLLAWMALAADPDLRLEHHRPLRYDVTLDVDPGADTFSGALSLEVALDAPTTRLALNAEALDVTSATLRTGDSSRPARVRVVDEVTVEVVWKGKVGGAVTVDLAWTGTVVKDGPYGLFHARSGEHDLLFTQYEAEKARQVLPCFDQPAFKTPWRVRLRVPHDMPAFTNTPEVSRVVEGDHDLVTFEETPPLPTYLLAMAVGPFDVVDAGTAGRAATPIRILVPPGRGPDAAYAAEVTAPILTALEAWFDLPYPYAKLDVVGIPNTVSFGAMETPGLVTFDLTTLVASPASDDVARRRRYEEWQAHELAHQWFGNFVTMPWWDELWLNEGFASWMGAKTVATLHPDWPTEFDRLEMREWALGSDALDTARRIREPIVVRGDIEAAFDGITYAKGQMVLDMFESWIGPDAFRAGVQDHVRAHPHGTGTTAGFLAAIEARAGKPVAGPFTTFLDQPGAPKLALDLDCTAAPVVRLAQSRFLPADPDAPGLWSLPVCVRYATPEGSARACTLLTEPTGTLPLDTDTCPAWVVPNAEARGYYRPVIAPDALEALLDTPGALTPVERTALLFDATAALQAGLLEPAILLERVDALLALDDVPATRGALSVAAGLDAHLVTEDRRPAYDRWILHTFGPLAATVGFEGPADEGEELRLLRSLVLRVVGGADPALRAEARRRLPELLAGRGAAPEALHAAIHLGAVDGDAALFDTVVAALGAAQTEDARDRAITALAAFADPTLVARTMAMALDKDLALKERVGLVFGLLSDRRTRDVAWAIVRDDPDRVAATVPALYRHYVVYTGGSFCDAAHRAEVEDTFARRARKWLGGARALAEVLEGIDVCIAATAAQRPGVDAFLDARSAISP